MRLIVRQRGIDRMHFSGIEGGKENGLVQQVHFAAPLSRKGMSLHWMMPQRYGVGYGKESIIPAVLDRGSVDAIH